MLDKIEKQFLQACINYGTIDITKAEELFNTLCEVYDVQRGDENKIKEIIKKIDTEIREFEQSLSIVIHPINNVEYVVFGLLTDNKPQYTDIEQKYFSALLKFLITSENFSMHWNDIYNISDESLNNSRNLLPKQRVQELSKLWMSQGYLLENENMIYLGPRSMLEFSDFFKNAFPDFVKSCSLCNKVLYWGVKCDCNAKFHRNCIRKYLTKKSTCPACKTAWNTPLL